MGLRFVSCNHNGLELETWFPVEAVIVPHLRRAVASILTSSSCQTVFNGNDASDESNVFRTHLEDIMEK
jgi:hypothetical protein